MVCDCLCVVYLVKNEIKIFPGSFILTGLIETAAIPYLGLKIEELSLDEKAEILFVDQRYATMHHCS